MTLRTDHAARIRGEQTMANKLAVVTGGTSGIGLSVIEGMVERGLTKVAIIGFPPAGEEAKADSERRIAALKEKLGEENVLVSETNVADYPAMEAVMEKAAAMNNRRIDYLLGNAGIQEPYPFEEQFETSNKAAGKTRFQALIDINLMGKVNAAYAALPYLKEGSHIINTSSVHGHVGSDGRTPYCAAMHATLGFTKALGLDFAEKGIKVNSISPAFIETPLAIEPLERMIAEDIFNDMDEAIKWRLQYQRDEWVQMKEVVKKYCDVLDGTIELKTGEDIHDDSMTKGYIQKATEKGGAIFQKVIQTAVDALAPKGGIVPGSTG